ncbi:MAG: hypothetical protein U0R77_04025 [Mycolicibacterium insubricum]
MRKIGRIGDFAVACSGLLPANVREPEFLSALSRRLPRIADLEPRVWAALAADPDYIALCHWNANIDNAWFWRDAAGVLRCGLMDWGCVSRMNVGMALWGSLSAAETSPWDTRFVEFTRVFAREFAYAGGPRIDPERLARFVLLYATVMGGAWLIDVPALIQRRLGDSARGITRLDSAIKDDEALRAPLQLLTNLLNLWQTRDLDDLLDGV